MDNMEFFAEVRELMTEMAAVAKGYDGRVVIYATAFLAGMTIADGPLDKRQRNIATSTARNIIDEVVNGDLKLKSKRTQ